MSSQRRIGSAFYVLCFFLVVGNFCRSYHVHNTATNNINNSRARTRIAAEEKNLESDRRTFFANMATMSLTIWGLSPLKAEALDVVLPGEMKPQEPKNRRIGGLAAKIRTVGNIMVSPIIHIKKCNERNIHRSYYLQETNLTKLCSFTFPAYFQNRMSYKET